MMFSSRKILFIVFIFSLCFGLVYVYGADWDITSGTKHEFDTVQGNHNSLVKINDTHYLNTYGGADYDGYAVVLEVNQTDWTISNNTPFEFDTVQGGHNSLVKINDTHYLNTYRGSGDDGYAVVLVVDLDTLTITSGTKHEFDTVQGNHNSLVKINDTHYLNTYGGSDSDSAVVLVVDLDTLTITNGTKHEFDTVLYSEGHNSLVKINDTHYLNTYRGADYDGYAVVLVVDLDTLTITNGTAHEFDTVRNSHNSLVKINDTHYLNTYGGTNFDGYAVVLVVDLDTLTITSDTKQEFDTDHGMDNSLVQIDSTHYLNTYIGSDYDGHAVVLTVDLDTLTITNGTAHEFDTAPSYYNSLVKINDTHYLNTYSGLDYDGYAVILTVTGDIPPRYSENSTNSTYSGTDILHALKWEDGVGLDTYIFSFDNGTGTFVNDSLVDISGTSHWSNVTKGINHTVGSTIRWQVFANDTTNNWNNTGIYQYLTTDIPTITANVSDPATVYTDTDWKINMTIVDDDSGDTLTGYIQFYMNGSSYSTVQSQVAVNDTNTLISTLGSSNFLKDYNLTAEVWAGDGTINTSKTNLTVTVSNTVPTTTTPTLSPTIGYKNISTITCNNATVTDTDNDTITWYYQWYLNGTENETTQTYSNSSYDKGDTLICEIWGDDGDNNSTRYNSTTMTIQNSKPIVSNVEITPSPAEISDDLNVTYTYFDFDGDTETDTYFQWYINDTINETSRDLSSGNLTSDSDIIISVSVNDGGLNSTWLNSSTMTVGDSTDPILHTHYMSSTSGYTNIAFTIGINVTEANTIEWVKVEINNPNSDKTNYTMSISATNNSEHYYTKSYTPTIVGTYDFYFYTQDGSSNYDSYNGTQYYEASTAPTPPTGSGGSDTTIIVSPTQNLTKVIPIEIKGIIRTDTESFDEFQITNKDLTPSKYTLTFDCSDYPDPRSLCDYLKFRNPINNNRTDILTSIVGDGKSTFITYYLKIPSLDPDIYHADIMIESDKGDSIRLPLEYEVKESMTLLDIIREYLPFGRWLTSVFKSFEIPTLTTTKLIYDNVTNETIGQEMVPNKYMSLNIYNGHFVLLLIAGFMIIKKYYGNSRVFKYAKY